MAKSVRNNLASKGLNLGKEELKNQLKEQGGVIQKLQEAQLKVLQDEGLDERDLIQAQQVHANADPELMDILKGFETMLDESLYGLVPVLPWMVEPSITQAQIQECQSKLHKTEVDNVCKRFSEAGGVLKSVQELGRALASASNEAETAVFKEFAITSEEFYSSIGLHCRRDENFKREREEIERDHINRMVKMFRPASPAVPTGPMVQTEQPAAAASEGVVKGPPGAAGPVPPPATEASEEKK